MFLRIQTFKEIMGVIARRTQIISKGNRNCQQIETKSAASYGILLSQHRNSSIGHRKMLLLKAGEAYCHTSELIFSECFPSMSTDGKM